MIQALLETLPGGGWGLVLGRGRGVEAIYLWDANDGISRSMSASPFLRLTQVRAMFCPRPSWAVADVLLAQRESGSLPLKIVCVNETTEKAVNAAIALCCCQSQKFLSVDTEYKDEFICAQMQGEHRFVLSFKDGKKYAITRTEGKIQIFDESNKSELIQATRRDELSSLNDLGIRVSGFREMRHILCGERFLPALSATDSYTRQLYCLEMRALNLEQVLNDEGGLGDSLAKIQKIGPLKNCENKHVNDSSDLNLLFLGTGASRSSSRRAQSAIFLNFTQGPSCLLDCGSGTLDQFRRELGIENTIKKLAQVNLIWISHRHWDHCGGLLSLLEATLEARNKELFSGDNRDAAAFLRKQLQLPTFASVPKEEPPLLLVAPRCVLDLVKASIVCKNLRTEVLEGAKPRTYHAGISLTSVRVTHCRDAYAVVVRHGKELLAFSGDCRPSEALSNEIKCRGQSYNTRILIHEATFSDEHQTLATAKKHSTVSEAIHVATTANATALILTHFSQRYLALSNIASTIQKRIPIAAAFDGLRLSANELVLFANVSKHVESSLAQLDESSNFFNRKRPRSQDFLFYGDNVNKTQKNERFIHSNCTTLSPRQRCIERRLLAFYRLYAPEKLHDVPKLLPLFDRSFPAMNAKLERKYGQCILDPSLPDDDNDNHDNDVLDDDDDDEKNCLTSSLSDDNESCSSADDDNCPVSIDG